MLAGPLNAAVRDLEALLPASPDAYPHNLDLAGGRVLVVRIDERAYRNASFLDDRILSPSTQGAWLPGAAVAEASRRVRDPRPLHFIFHTGHVGSTLVSRLLDETDAILSLREPLLLRTLADAHDALGRPESLLGEPQFEALLDMTLRLWSRGYAGTRAVVVKATSSAGRLAPADPRARAGIARRVPQPARGAVSRDAARRRQFGDRTCADTVPGACDACSPDASSRSSPCTRCLPANSPHSAGWSRAWRSGRRSQNTGRACLALDFDAFLADVAGQLASVAGHFGLAAESATIAAAAAGPVLRQYSKAPQLPYRAR